MKINKNKNDKCLRFGECSIYYIYILITGLLFLLKNSLLCLKDIEIQKDFNLFGVDTVIKNHGLIKLILEFIGYIIYGAIFMLILKKIKNENTEKKIEENNELENNNMPHNNSLIYNENSIFDKSAKNLLIACGVFAVQLTIRSILMFLQVWMFDLWVFNIIFISIFLKKIFKYKIYKHHIYTLIFNFVTNFILFIIASSIKNEQGESDYEVMHKIYGNYAFNFLFYLVYLSLSCMICFSQVMQKKVMDFEYQSPPKIVFMYGLISSIFSLIALAITSFVNCNETLSNNGLCPVSRPEYKNGISFLDNVLIYYDNLVDKYNENKTHFFLEILLIYPLYSFAGFMKYLCETMIVYRLNPNYVLISDNIFYSTKKIIRLFYYPTEIKTYLRLFGELIATIAYFFFLEFFEFNCLGLNFDTKINIDKRGKIEAISDILVDGESSNNNDNESHDNSSDLYSDSDTKEENHEEELKSKDKNNEN